MRESYCGSVELGQEVLVGIWGLVYGPVSHCAQHSLMPVLFIF